MFTGLVEEVGLIQRIEKRPNGANLVIRANIITEDLRLGDSVSVNGACLTAVHIEKDGFHADVMGETLRRTTIGELKPGSRVNLERAMALGQRLGGHLVSGHVDGIGVIREMKTEDHAVWIKIEAQKEVLKYLVEKGSVTLDGISLTVTSVTDAFFSVSIIPHSRQCTTLGEKKVGDPVNLEGDLIGKYVEKLLRNDSEVVLKTDSDLSIERLIEYGY